MSVRAIAKGVRISPRKISEVAALVRGRSVSDALTILEHTPRRGAEAVKSVIASAKANAEHNHQYKSEGLFLSEISVTAGPRFKRYKKGRGYRGGMDPYQLKTSHIRVVIDGTQRPASKKIQTTGKEEKK